jgi:hypothetical protein
MRDRASKRMPLSSVQSTLILMPGTLVASHGHIGHFEIMRSALR